MIRRMLMTEILEHTKKRDEFKRKAKELKKKLGKDSPEYKEKLKELNKQSPKAIFLEEDCNLFAGSGFKKGKELIFEEAKRLSDFGYHLVWVSDRPSSDEEKKDDFIYTIKSEIEGTLSKAMVLIDEADGKKAGSTIKYIEKNDLLKQTIEAIQSDGAKYVAFHIFGEALGKINSLRAYIQQFYKKAPERVDLFANVSMGNLYKYQQKLVEKKIKDKDGKVIEERSNYVLNFMINLGFGFMATLRKIQNERLERNPDDVPDLNRKPDPLKRHGYDNYQLVDGAMAAFFAEYGYLHFTIDNLVQRFTNPFFNKEGKIEGSGIIKLQDKNQLVYDKHVNVSYNLMSATKKFGFDSVISRDILQYHHRGLNDTGYPKRKMTDEKVSETGADGQVIGVYNQKCYEQKITEMARLTSIVNFYVEYSSHTPFHIPFQRDNIVRYLLINSVYPEDDKRKEDHEGIWDIQTHYPQDKKFDAFLVDRFLKSVNIYKIGEEVPIYNFNNSKKPLYDAIVERQNEFAHRPVVLIKDGEDEKELDLSLPENESLYIGEYIPSLRFQDVIDEFHLDKVEGGIILTDDELDDDEMSGSTNKVDQENENMLDDIFGENEQVQEVDELDSPAPSQSIEDLLSDMPAGLAQAKSESDKEVEVKEDEMIEDSNLSLESEDNLPDLNENELTSDKDDIVPPLSEDDSLGEEELDSLMEGFDTPPIVEDNEMNEIEEPVEHPEDEISFEPPKDEVIEESDKAIDPNKDELDGDDLMKIFDDPFSEEEEGSTAEVSAQKEEAVNEEVSLPEMEAEHDEELPDMSDLDLPEDEHHDSELPDLTSDGLHDEIELPDETEEASAELPEIDEIPQLDDIEEETPDQTADDEIPLPEETPAVAESLSQASDEKLYKVYINHHHEYLPYGLGMLVSSNSNEKRFRIRYIAQQVKETSREYIYHYSLVNGKDQQVISVYNPREIHKIPDGEPIFFIKGQHSGEFQEEISKVAKPGAYHLLLYKKENDPKQRLTVEKEQAKYIVRIKGPGNTPEEPEVSFIRYIKETDDKFEYVKDQNCGKDFDLSRYPFFKIGRELSSKEIVQVLGLVAV